MNDLLATIPTWLLILLFVISVAVVLIGTFGVTATLDERRQRRTLVALAARECPACHRQYGSAVIAQAKVVLHLWDPLPGQSLTGADLPGTTFCIVCPHCATEQHYRRDGRLFDELPELSRAAQASNAARACE